MSSVRRWRTAAVVVCVAASAFAAPRSIRAVQHARTPFERGWDAGTPVTMTGVLTVFYQDDFANRRAEIVHMVRDQRTRRSYRLRFERETPARFSAGATITLSGRLNGSDIYMLADQASAAVVSPATSISTTSAVPVTGDQHTLVIIANLRDAAVNCLTSNVASDLTGIMWTGTGTWPDPTYNYSVDALYRQMTNGGVSFSGTVVGPYTINYSASDPCCDTAGWASAADAAAAASGVDLSAYPRKLYFMPPNVNAGFSGIADLGVTPSRAFVFNSCMTPDVFAHELGHNLGFYHASTPTDEYGDHSDVMGGAAGYFRQVDAPHRVQAGWLPAGQVQTLSADGVYAVSALELDPSTAPAPQSLRVFKSDTGEYYYVSYRAGIGFDQVLSCCSYLNRLNVHRWAGNKTYLVAALDDGQTFTDPVTGFSVTQVSHDNLASSASVHIGSGCGSAAPSVSLSPQSQSGAAGTGINYDTALPNNHGPAGAPTTFSLAGAIPAGWTGSLSAGTLLLDPGSTGHATLTVTSASNATPGSYGDSVSVSDRNVPVHAASVAGVYNVVPPCSSVPAVTISPSGQSAPAATKLAYTVTVTDRDASGCGGTTFTVAPSVPAGWSAALSSPTLALQPGSTGSVVLSITSAAAAVPAQYGVAANLSDGVNPVHNGSASATYTVQAADTAPPTPPANLTATVKRQQIALAWSPATDNVAVAGYQVWRNGALVATTTAVGWTDQAIVAGTYIYFVTAYDAAANISKASNSVTVKSGSGKSR